MSNVGSETVPRGRTGDAECPVAEMSSGMRKDEVLAAAERTAAPVDSCNRHTYILYIRWCQFIYRIHSLNVFHSLVRSQLSCRPSYIFALLVSCGKRKMAVKTERESELW